MEVLETADAARKRLQQGGVDKVIFTSRDMLLRARELKGAFPRVEVIVLTGLIPEDEVMIVSKNWLGSTSLEDAHQRILIDDNQR